MNVETQPARRGPVKQLDTLKTTVMVEADILDWGKKQPGGLSETVRRLLREAMEREGAKVNA